MIIVSVNFSTNIFRVFDVLLLFLFLKMRIYNARRILFRIFSWLLMMIRLLTLRCLLLFLCLWLVWFYAIGLKILYWLKMMFQLCLNFCNSFSTLFFLVDCKICLKNPINSLWMIFILSVVMIKKMQSCLLWMMLYGLSFKLLVRHGVSSLVKFKIWRIHFREEFLR